MLSVDSRAWKIRCVMGSVARSWVAMVAVIGSALSPLLAEPPGDTKAPAAKSEEGSPEKPEHAVVEQRVLIDRIEKLALRGSPEFQADLDLAARIPEQADLVAAVDALLKSYPDTVYREPALIAKLAALGLLARTASDRLDQLLALTEEIARTNPKGELASENAYFAIQAFILGARREKMPDQRRMEGAMERYRAFLSDFPGSARRSVVWASLVRNMIAMKLVDEARREIDKFEREFPMSAAVKRSKGEINRARAPGLPFALIIVTPSGEKIKTKQYFGDVVVVHFWASWNKASVEQIAKLADLQERFKDRGLRIIGVSLDQDREKFDSVIRDRNVTWPQMYDPKGHEGEIVMATGVVELPLVFTIDRMGLAYSADRGDDLEAQVTKLLAEPVPPKPGSLPEIKP